MFIRQAKITDLISEFVGKPHVFGQTDCNLILAKYIDVLTGSTYYEQLHNEYEDVKTGIKAAKRIGFISAKHVLEKVAAKVEQPINGDVIVQKHTSGKSSYYSTSIVWGNKALIEKNNIYTLVDLEDTQFSEVYRIGE